MNIEQLIIPFFVFFFLGIAVLIFLFGIRQKQKLRENFAVFAEKLGCPAQIPQGYFGGFPSLSGNYRKHALRVYMFTRTSGCGKNRSTTTYTAFTISVNNSANFEFNIFEQGFFTTLATKLGMQDIQIGDEIFDKEFIIKSNNETMVTNFLSPGIKQQFLEMAERYTAFGVKLNGQQFYYEAANTLASSSFGEKLETLINFMCDLADRVEEIQRGHWR
ncbi:DUF3137 domain-containing protein [bacterium]|nr:DUF3137 domain-containing protein [bacterium]